MAVTLNGTSQYLTRSSTPVTAEAFTLACWFNATDATSFGWMMMVSEPTDATGDSIRGLRIRGDVAGDPISAQTNSSGEAQSSSGYSINTWHHACGIFGASNNRQVFLDGGSSTTNTASISVTTPSAVTVGALNAFSTVDQYFPGQLAECAIWNATLTGAEVAILADRVSPLFVRPESLVFYQPLHGGSPAPDYMSATGLTVNGSPSYSDGPGMRAYSLPVNVGLGTAAAASTARSFSVVIA